MITTRGNYTYYSASFTYIGLRVIDFTLPVTATLRGCPLLFRHRREGRGSRQPTSARTPPVCPFTGRGWPISASIGWSDDESLHRAGGSRPGPTRSSSTPNPLVILTGLLGNET